MKTTGFIIKIIILFISLSCFSCINNIKQNESIENFSYPILIDTGELKTQDSILVYTFQNTTAHHNIFYLGKLKDSVKISTFPLLSELHIQVKTTYTIHILALQLSQNINITLPQNLKFILIQPNY